MKNLKKNLRTQKKEVKYQKVQNELDSLFEEQEKLIKKKLDYNVEQKMRNNRQRIGYLLKEVDKYIN